MGRNLINHLLEDGARVLATDVDVAAVDALPAEAARVSAGQFLSQAMDVYAPCALGGTVTDSLAEHLTGKIICGGANNQLQHDDIARVLVERDVLYVPDFVANAGGIIQVADEALYPGAFQMPRATAKARGIFDTTTRVLCDAAERGVTPVTAAMELAEARMTDIGSLRTFHLPSQAAT